MSDDHTRIYEVGKAWDTKARAYTERREVNEFRSLMIGGMRIFFWYLQLISMDLRELKARK